MSNESESTGTAGAEAGWQPRITAFVCRWCTYAGADLAGTSRLKYPPHIRIIKLPCTGRIDTLFILRAFRSGADGVLVSGCHPGDCHYTSGNYIARRRFVVFREMMRLVGLEDERLHFSWVSAAEGAKFVEVVGRVTEEVRRVGPFRGYRPARSPGRGGGGVPERRAAAGREVAGREARPLDAAAIRADLESGAVRAVLGLRDGRRDGRLRVAWVRDAAQAEALRAPKAGRPVLVTYLLRKLRENPEGVFGIVAGPLDRAAIAVLQTERQIDPERIRVYEVGGAGDGPAGASETGRAGAVAAGERPAREALDLFPVPSLDAPAAQRWDFWTAEFERCLRCHACRETCPLCACTRCVADKTRPRWIDSSATPEGNWLWNVTRALHLGGRCVECGNCDAACPVGIPLLSLTRHLNRVAEREWGPRADDAAARSPLVSFRLEDKAEFIL